MGLILYPSLPRHVSCSFFFSVSIFHSYLTPSNRLFECAGLELQETLNFLSLCHRSFTTRFRCPRRLVFGVDPLQSLRSRSLGLTFTELVRWGPAHFETQVLCVSTSFLTGRRAKTGRYSTSFSKVNTDTGTVEEVRTYVSASTIVRRGGGIWVVRVPL